MRLATPGRARRSPRPDCPGRPSNHPLRAINPTEDQPMARRRALSQRDIDGLRGTGMYPSP